MLRKFTLTGFFPSYTKHPQITIAVDTNKKMFKNMEILCGTLDIYRILEREYLLSISLESRGNDLTFGRDPRDRRSRPCRRSD